MLMVSCMQVYSGKAMHALLQEIRLEPNAWRGRRVLFIHTGKRSFAQVEVRGPDLVLPLQSPSGGGGRGIFKLTEHGMLLFELEGGFLTNR